MSTEKTLDEQIAEIESKRKAIKDRHEAAFKVQLLADLQALSRLEEEHGFERVLRINIPGWKEDSGAATLFVFRVPLESEKTFKAWEDEVGKAAKGSPKVLNASRNLAKSCMVYPDRDSQHDLWEASIELAAGILAASAGVIAKRAQGEAQEEGKE